MGREGSGVRGSVSPRVRARGRETGFERGARSDVRSRSEAEAARGGPARAADVHAQGLSLRCERKRGRKP